MEPRPSPDNDGLPIIKGIQLIGTHQLPDRVRSIFPFAVFNAVQSKCLPTVYGTDDNFVLSAPTGSGKTAILELAICRLVAAQRTSSFKIVYQAPTKSLCAERRRDWSEKFSHLGLTCAELTGDTEQGQLKHVQQADILVTTPEKWDAMTRQWRDHRKLMELVKLFLIDEVHILKEDRGASLEAVVSRMKSIGSDVRFVALSATVPNSDDVAAWLGRSVRVPGMPAAREVFGEEFRPVELQRHVVGLQWSAGNDFAFDGICNNRLPQIIAKYTTRPKPIMVFCMTRKSTEATAQLLAEWWSRSAVGERYWDGPHSHEPGKLSNKILQGCAKAGVAFHHAGLDALDRAGVERGYLNGDIAVICCTSTLAVGVNLPCHLAIIKNTVTYQDTGTKEYSDLEVMQMLGRAGRPQFERTAVAVIITRSEKVNRYETMVSGQEILESRLHLNLIEHLNAEVNLGTIKDITTARAWLEGTFLHVRYRKNPQHYRLQFEDQLSRPESGMESVCKKSLDLLRDYELITPSDVFRCTQFGDAMARYYVQFDTMKLIFGLQPRARVSEILSALAQSAELRTIRFRAAEKQLFKDINASSSIKYVIPVDIASAPHKISLMIQATLGGLDSNRDEVLGNHRLQFQTEQYLIFQHVHRLMRCIIDCSLYREDSITVRSALELARGLASRCWDDSPLQLMQLEKIGPVTARKLIGSNIRTIEALEDTESQKIDMILSKNPPFGAKLLQEARTFPKLRVSLKLVGHPRMRNVQSTTCFSIEIKAELGFLNESPPLIWKKENVQVALLAATSDGRVVHFCRISAKTIGSGHQILIAADITGPHQMVDCSVACESIAGTLQTATLNPKIAASAFPIADPEAPVSPSAVRQRPARRSRPTSATEEFGDADIDDSDLVAAANDYQDIDEMSLESLQPSRTQANNGRKRKATNDAVVAPESTFEPRRLPNGNWECQHKCQDKQSCKHMCCREGTESRPKLSKKRKLEQEQAESNRKDKQNQSPINEYFKQSKQKEERELPDPNHGSQQVLSSSRFHTYGKTYKVDPAYAHEADDIDELGHSAVERRGPMGRMINSFVPITTPSSHGLFMTSSPGKRSIDTLNLSDEHGPPSTTAEQKNNAPIADFGDVLDESFTSTEPSQRTRKKLADEDLTPEAVNHRRKQQPPKRYVSLVELEKSSTNVSTPPALPGTAPSVAHSGNFSNHGLDVDARSAVQQFLPTQRRHEDSDLSHVPSGDRKFLEKADRAAMDVCHTNDSGNGLASGNSIGSLTMDDIISYDPVIEKVDARRGKDVSNDQTEQAEGDCSTANDKSQPSKLEEVDQWLIDELGDCIEFV